MKILLMCLCCTLVHIPSIILRYEPFREEVSKKQKQMLYLTYIIGLILNIILYFSVYHFMHINIAFYKCNLLLFCILMAVVNIVIIQGRILEHLFTFGLTAIIVFMLLTVATYIEANLPIMDIYWQITLNAGVLCAVFTILQFNLRRLMRSTITPFLRTDSREYWKNIWFIPIAMFFASLLSFPLNEYVRTPLQVVSRLLIGIATLFICRSISYDYIQMQKKKELDLSLNRQKEYYEALSNQVQEARKSRHDFKHHMSVISVLTDKEDLKGLKNYCNELLHIEMNGSLIPFTGNSAADGIIYHYVLLCQNADIQFKVDGMLQKINILDIDLCVLLGNALENAFTACQAMEGEAFINLYFHQNGGVLTILIENSFDGIVLKDKEIILSRKRDNKSGIGLTSMQNICKKYNGNIHIKYENYIFYIMLLLDLNNSHHMSVFHDV